MKVPLPPPPSPPQHTHTTPPVFYYVMFAGRLVASKHKKKKTIHVILRLLDSFLVWSSGDRRSVLNGTLSPETESIQGAGRVGVMCNAVFNGTFVCDKRK